MSVQEMMQMTNNALRWFAALHGSFMGEIYYAFLTDSIPRVMTHRRCTTFQHSETSGSSL
jgi:hypothetical protein